MKTNTCIDRKRKNRNSGVTGDNSWKNYLLMLRESHKGLRVLRDYIVCIRLEAQRNERTILH